jgi:hypothetical protein
VKVANNTLLFIFKVRDEFHSFRTLLLMQVLFVIQQIILEQKLLDVITKLAFLTLS